MVAGDGNQQVSAQFGAFCFPNGTTYLDVQFGNYSGLDRSSPEWHSTVFYFMSKEKVEGPCRGSGTQKIGGNVFVLSSLMDRIYPNISSGCPAVFLAPSNFPEVLNFALPVNTVCAGVSFLVIEHNSDGAVDAFTVQNGVTQFADPFIFSSQSLPEENSADYLRNAVLLKTESQYWIKSEMGVSYAHFNNISSCSNVDYVDSLADNGRIDSNPFGTQQMDYTLIFSNNIAKMSDVDFSVSTNGEECMSLNASFKRIGESESNHTNVLDLPRSFTLSDLASIRFIYRQLDGYGCSSPSYFVVDYRVIDTSTTTVPPTTTTIPTTTSATTTSSSSSTPLATSTVNWNETTTTSPSTTTSPKATTTYGKNGAISPQFVVCTMLSALLFSFLL